MKNKDKILSTLIAVFFAYTLYVQWGAADSGDKGWILFVTGRILAGKHLFTEVLSVHPPLIFWLYAIPVKLSQLIGITDGHALFLAGLALIALSIMLCLRIIRAHPLFIPRMQWQFTLLLGMVFFAWTNPLYFLDREHLFLIMIFPYLLRNMPAQAGNAAGRGEKMLTGLLAGIGFCIKPHCALVFVAIQLTHMLMTRSARMLASSENIVIYLVGSAYLLSVYYFTPEYFTLVLPMTMATYSVITLGGGALFFAVSFLVFAVSFADYPWRITRAFSNDILYLLGASAGFLAYALVNNGWAYAWNPLNCMLLFTTGWVLWQYGYLRALNTEDKKLARKLAQGRFACWLNLTCNTLCVLVLTISSFFVGCGTSCKIEHGLQDVIAQTHAKTFGAISIDFNIWSHITRTTPALWSTRINSIWMLPKFFVSDDAFKRQHQGIIDYLTKAYAEDLDQQKPDLMFVDDTDMFYKIYHPVNLIAYLSEDPAFRAAWAHYRYHSSVDFCTAPGQKPQIPLKKQDCKYDVYERIVP